MKNKTALFLLFLLFCLFACGENLSAQKRKVAPRRIVAASDRFLIEKSKINLSPEMQRRLDAFHFAWETIKNNYFDQTFSGINWENIRKEYEPRVLNAKTDGELHNLLQEMINRLNRSHLAIIPPEVYRAIEKAKAEAKAKENRSLSDSGETKSDETDEGNETDFIFENDENAKFGIGIEVRLINDRFVISRIEKKSAAEKAGLKTGYVIEKINDVALGDLLKNIEIYYANVKNIKRHLPTQIVSWFLNGDDDSFVKLSFLDETDQLKNLKIGREKLSGETISIGKNFPEQYLKYETASLSEDVGYVKFNLFAIPVIEKFCNSLTTLKDKKALIIDLRGNTGGILATMVGLSGMLTDKSIDLGTQIYKIGSENMVAYTKAKNYKGKIVFLVDNQTVSAAEIFASALQENNRALVIGEKTAGEALPSVSVKLPTGAFLLYPIANFKTRNGNFLEGKGVEPNFVVAMDRKSLLEGKDPQIDAALKIIKDNVTFTKSLSVMLEAQTEKVKTLPPPATQKSAKILKGRQLAVVTIHAPPPAAEQPPPPAKKDEKALQVITEFINAIGGDEALNRINSYVLKGTTEIAYRGARAEAEISILSQKPDRYAEIMKSSSVGEVRQVFSGKKSFVQTEYGLDRAAPLEIKVGKIEIFAPLFGLLKKDSFKSLSYMGAFDLLGEKAHVIEALTTENQTVAFAFNAKSKLLVSFTQQSFVVLLDDYRPVEKLLLPFIINRNGFMNVRLNEIKLNVPIEDGNFAERENCYDKAN